jgi:hypothetical protein
MGILFPVLCTILSPLLIRSRPHTKSSTVMSSSGGAKGAGLKAMWSSTVKNA